MRHKDLELHHLYRIYRNTVDDIIDESGTSTLILGIGAKVIPFKPLHCSM